MLIGDVARLANVTPATIRYYEEIGLLAAPARSGSGYRRYSSSTVEELTFIKKAQSLGFSLENIAEILKLSRAGEAPCAHVLEIAERNAAAAEERIRQLQLFHQRLVSQILRWKRRAMPSCNSSGLCEMISSVELPESVPVRVSRGGHR